MINGDREYIILCKHLIEEKFHFGNGNGRVRQRDLESLSDTIEEKSGIKLSLSTLKRLWKEDYGQTPHPSTLQALVSILGYKDWQEFKLKENPDLKDPILPRQKKPKGIVFRWVILVAIVLIPVLVWLIAFRPKKEEVKAKPIIKGPVTLTGNKTVAEGVPSTIIFNYDLSNVEADSFSFNNHHARPCLPARRRCDRRRLRPGQGVRGVARQGAHGRAGARRARGRVNGQRPLMQTGGEQTGIHGSTNWRHSLRDCCWCEYGRRQRSAEPWAADPSLS